MPSSYTTSLRLTLPATGELSGQWGNTVNTGITELLDSAVAGTASISTWGGAGVAYTLSSTSGAADEARKMFIVASGSPGEAKNVICPAVSKFYVFRNDTTGGFALTLKTPSGTGISVPAGQYKFLYCDGTNVVEMFNSAGALSLSGNLTLSGGTANGVLYLDGSKVATSGSALVFDGSNFGIGTSSPTQKLEVSSGNVLVTQPAATNATLTVAGNGNAEASGFQLRQNSSNQAIINNRANGPLLFYTNNTLQATLDSSGNLGIGTSSPGQKLSVNGGVNVVGAATLAAAQGAGLMSFESPIMRCYVGDGTGYSWAFSKRAASVTTDLMTLNDSGNLGLGVTPSAWGANFRALQIGRGTALWSGTASDATFLSQNAYYDGSNFRYLQSTLASYYSSQLGQHLWYTAPSGTAGNAISFTQAMTLDASGNLGVGTTSPLSRGHFVASSNGDDDNTITLGFVFGANSVKMGSIGTHNSDGSNGGLMFSTLAAGTLTERARITSGGDLLVGTTSNPNNSKAVIAGSLTQNGAYINSSYNYTDISGTTYGLWRIQLLTGGGGRIDLSEYGTDVATPNAAQYTITFYVTSGGAVNATSSKSFTNYANTVLLVKDSTYLYLAVSKGHPNGAGYWNVEFRGSNNSADLAFTHSSTTSGYTTVYTV